MPMTRLLLLCALASTTSGCLRGSDPSPGNWEFSPPSLQFTTFIGTTNRQTINLANNLSTTLEIRIGRPVADGPCPEDSILPPSRSVSIPPGGRQEIRIEHAPELLPDNEDNQLTERLFGKCNFTIALWNEDDGEATTRGLLIDAGVVDFDRDGDGIGRGSGDCNDTPGSGEDINPDVPELCDGIDNDCDGLIDDRDDNEAAKWLRLGIDTPEPVSLGKAPFNPDLDGDSFPREVASEWFCAAPVGWVDAPGPLDPWDCNDQLADTYPGAAERPMSGRDIDCDGMVTCYADRDLDGFGSPTDVVSHPLTDPFCINPTAGVEPAANDPDDCNDANPAVHPAATEVCGDPLFGTNNIDEDCDRLIDNNDSSLADASIWFQDVDGDGFGGETTRLACEHTPPTSHALVSGDCDDLEPTVYPGAVEICDTRDNDCDNGIDDFDLQRDQPPGIDPATGLYRIWFDRDTLNSFYIDQDLDQFGSADAASVPDGIIERCAAPFGYSAFNTDCNDARADINPSQADAPVDGVDTNCDGIEQCYQDLDLDGFGENILVDANAAIEDERRCRAPGLSAVATDCNDDPADFGAVTYPGALEICDPQGRDNDCDGRGDAIDDNVESTTTYLADRDGDGFGNPYATRLSCVRPNGFVEDGGPEDCDDRNFFINPAATEVPANGVDQDCDGFEDCYVDADGDRFGNDAGLLQAGPTDCNDVGVSNTRDDCDDTLDSIRPGLVERCDPLDADENCNGVADDGEDNVTGRTDWFFDGDADGFGAGDAFRACDPPPDHVAERRQDCNDNDDQIYPGATEICDAGDVDEDCDGRADDDDLELIPSAAVFAIPTWLDDDGDGYGRLGSAPTPFCDVPAGRSDNDRDCDDADISVFPGAPEGAADGIDQNCDNAERCYVDADGDGYGGTAVATFPDCSSPGASARNDDCADNTTLVPEAASIHPDAPEVCDGRDNDCDSDIDDEDGDRVSDLSPDESWYIDRDRDGFGDPLTVRYGCAPLAGYVARTDGAGLDLAVDCDDRREDVYPGALELPANGRDDDCDTEELCWCDQDGDGVGRALTIPSALLDCTTASPSATGTCTAASSVSASNNDCDDTNASVLAGATTVWYRDDDGDGFGDPAQDLVTDDCSAPAGPWVPNADDCDDSTALAYPHTTIDLCDGIDLDCDGETDEDEPEEAWFIDNDGDGYGDPTLVEFACAPPTLDVTWVTETGDCDDFNDLVSPGATEIPCNGIDEDCESGDDTSSGTSWFLDLDGDGFGVGSAVTACTAPPNRVGNRNDCDDTDASAFPGADEVCDGDLERCGGTVDLGADCGTNATPWYSPTHGNYIFIDQSMTQPAARNLCESLGYGLLFLETVTEESAVGSQADALLGNNADYWLGASSACTPAPFQWQWERNDGSCSNFNAFARGRSSAPATDDVYLSTDGTSWDIVSDTVTQEVVCELE